MWRKYDHYRYRQLDGVFGGADSWFHNDYFTESDTNYPVMKQNVMIVPIFISQLHRRFEQLIDYEDILFWLVKYF